MHTISKSLEKHYTNKVKVHGANAKGVDWRDEETAYLRYQVMKNMLSSKHRKFSLLDVGCGYGGFLGFLKKYNYCMDYTGIDISDLMIDYAKRAYKDSIFLNEDYLNHSCKFQYDYIICNGILTQKLDSSLLDMEAYLKLLIYKMFNDCKIGCCFNLMSSRVNYYSSHLFYRHPSEVITYCLSELTPYLKVDHSYGLYEFTVYLYKKPLDDINV